MSHFLQVGAGPFHLLLEAEGIHEIVDLADLEAPAAGRCDWRGRMLATIDTGAMLGATPAARPPARVGVVYSAATGAPPVLLKLDGFPRWRRVAAADLLPLPAVPEPTFRLFDRVLPDTQAGVQLYRLRRPLDPELLAVPLAAHQGAAPLQWE